MTLNKNDFSYNLNKGLDINVLIFPGGNEIGLEIAKSLRYCKGIHLFSGSSGVKNHSNFYFKNCFEIPDISDPEKCISTLIKVIELYKIDVIYPANPLVIDFLDKKKSLIPAKIAMTNSKSLSITRSKKITYETLSQVLPTPKFFDKNIEDLQFPLFIKPDSLYGSQGTRLVLSYDEYKLNPCSSEEICCEYLTGEEYTVDCFSDSKYNLLFVGARTRERIRMGTSMHCEQVDEETKKILEDYARKIQTKIPISGGWFFQVKRSKNKTLKLLEVEARIAGTMSFHRVQGVNFPLLTLYDMYSYKLGIKTLEINDLEIDRSLQNRYKLKGFNYRTVYIDLDDTIIIKRKLNVLVISFLTQCINEGKKIILISKSLHPNPDNLLKKLRIIDFFDEIFWLKENEQKSNYIKDINSIFIDDSFSQRNEVTEKKGVLSFDPSMVELLIKENAE